MKRALTFVFAALSLPAFAAPAADDGVYAFIDRFYNRPLAAEGCQLSAPPQESEWQGANTAYCMKPAASHTVKRNGKTVRYVLYTGFAYDTQRKDRNGAHAASGLAELFVLEKDGSGWAIRQHGKSETGAWGEAPARDQWQFVQVGAQNWGYTAETGYTAQGVQSSGRFYLFSDDRNRIRSSFIPNGEDTAGYYGNCSNYKGRERRNCEEGQTSLDAKLSFNRKMKPEFGVWAVEARLSGTKGKKRYRNRPYLMPDNGKTHVVPKDYPLYVDVGSE